MSLKDYVIITDSTTDLPPELIEEIGVQVITMEVVIGEETFKNYPDGRELGFKEFYERIRNGAMPKTNQINVATYTENIEKAVLDGKDVLLLCFSSALSGTYQSSCIAVEEMREKYPDAKIITVDTKSASMGEGLLVYLAAKKKAEGMGIEELAKWVEDTKLNVCHWFTVDDLNHLKRGGRVSSATAVVGTLLGIKPVMHVDNEGRLIAVEKVRGRKASLDALTKHLFDTVNEKIKTVFISHGDCLEDAKYLAEKIREKIKSEITIGFIGPVIGAHSGPGTIALFFVGSHR